MLERRQVVNLSGLLKHQNQPCNRSLEVILPPSLDVSLLCCSIPTPLHPTYMHLRIELLGWGGGGVGPRHIAVSGHVEVAVGCVPAVAACGPGQGGLK